MVDKIKMVDSFWFFGGWSGSMVNTFWKDSFIGMFRWCATFRSLWIASQNRKYRFGNRQFQTIHVIDTSMDHRYCNTYICIYIYHPWLLISNPIHKLGIRMPSTGSRHSISASTTPSIAHWPEQRSSRFCATQQRDNNGHNQAVLARDIQQFASCHAQMLHVW